jgi:hypothetical protein
MKGGSEGGVGIRFMRAGGSCDLSGAEEGVGRGVGGHVIWMGILGIGTGWDARERESRGHDREESMREVKGQLLFIC